MFILLNKYFIGKCGKKVILTDPGGITMSPPHREVSYSPAIRVLQGKDGPLPRDSNLDFYYFTDFLFYLSQITQTQAFKSYPATIDYLGFIYLNSF